MVMRVTYDSSRPETDYVYEPQEDITTYELSKIVVHLIKDSKKLDRNEFTAGQKITDVVYGKLPDTLRRHFKHISESRP